MNTNSGPGKWSNDGEVRRVVGRGADEAAVNRSESAPAVSLMDGIGLPRTLIEVLRRKPELRLALAKAMEEEERRGRDD